MTLVKERPLSLSSTLLVKMEERKRPAPHDHDESTPPLKKQATSTVNGNSKGHIDADMPWKDDLEVGSFTASLPSSAEFLGSCLVHTNDLC